MASIVTRKRALSVVLAASVCLTLVGASFGSAARLIQNTKLAPAATRPEAKRLALLIVNTNYPDANAPIVGTLSAVEELGERLRARGFEVDIEEDATKAQMTSAIDRLVAKAGKGVDVFVTFSGYGIQSNRENFLVPTDAHIWNETDVGHNGIAVKTLLDRLHARGTAHTIAVLDASRRNPFERRFRKVATGLAAVEPPVASIVMSTTAPTSSGAGKNDAVLLHALSGTLGEADANIESLLGRARRKVSAASDGREVPTISSVIVDGFTL